MVEQKRAVIIGGGIGGLATAIALLQAGWQVRVFERAPKIEAVGAGLTLWHNAIKAMDSLGLGEVLLKHSLEDLHGGIMDWRGELLLKIADPQQFGIDGPLMIGLHRADLHAMLAEALPPGVLQTGAQFDRFTQDRNGVMAFFADGHVEQGDLLIGADGLRSKVRSQLFGFQEPVYSGQAAWRAVIPASAINLREPVGFEAWGHGELFGMVPLSKEQIYWFAAVNRPLGSQDPPEGCKAELLSIFAGWLDPVERLIEATPEAKILRNDIFDRDPINAWSSGRVVLLGDAAHPMCPNLGQGACQALEDAVVLGQELRRSADLSEALQSYERRRVKRANQILLASRQMKNLTHVPYSWACFLRDQTLQILPNRIQTSQIKSVIGV